MENPFSMLWSYKNTRSDDISITTISNRKRRRGTYEISNQSLVSVPNVRNRLNCFLVGLLLCLGSTGVHAGKFIYYILFEFSSLLLYSFSTYKYVIFCNFINYSANWAQTSGIQAQNTVVPSRPSPENPQPDARYGSAVVIATVDDPVSQIQRYTTCIFGFFLLFL